MLCNLPINDDTTKKKLHNLEINQTWRILYLMDKPYFSAGGEGAVLASLPPPMGNI
jgi:hypothetical protein